MSVPCPTHVPNVSQFIDLLPVDTLPGLRWPILARSEFVVSLSGPQDLATVPRLRHLLCAACENSTFDVLLDLTDVNFIDSRIAGVIIEFERRLAVTSRRLILVAPVRNVQRVLRICGLGSCMRTSVHQTSPSRAPVVAVPGLISRFDAPSSLSQWL